MPPEGPPGRPRLTAARPQPRRGGRRGSGRGGGAASQRAAPARTRRSGPGTGRAAAAAAPRAGRRRGGRGGSGSQGRGGRRRREHPLQGGPWARRGGCPGRAGLSPRLPAAAEPRRHGTAGGSRAAHAHGRRRSAAVRLRAVEAPLPGTLENGRSERRGREKKQKGGASQTSGARGCGQHCTARLWQARQRPAPARASLYSPFNRAPAAPAPAPAPRRPPLARPPPLPVAIGRRRRPAGQSVRPEGGRGPCRRSAAVNHFGAVLGPALEALPEGRPGGPVRRDGTRKGLQLRVLPRLRSSGSLRGAFRPGRESVRNGGSTAGLDAEEGKA